MIDFLSIEEKARGMSSKELIWAIQDCIEAALSSDEIEAGGRRVLKGAGYYRDEASVYRTELSSRKG